MRKVLILFAALFAGCGDSVDQVFDKLSGHETQTVVLVKDATTVTVNPMLLKSATPMMVIGSDSGICMVLKKEISLAPQPVMDKYFEEALGGAKFSAILRTKAGREFTMTSTGYSWQQRGVVTSTAEMAACLSCACGPKPSVGSEISEISLKASSPVRVLGIYWKSSNVFDKMNN